MKKEEEFNLFRCITCNSDEDLELGELFKHLEEVHNITKTEGSRNLILHLNKGKFHQSTYEWNIAGVKFYQYINIGVIKRPY